MPLHNPTHMASGIDDDALEHAVRQVGDRWSLRLVATLLDGDRTFGELNNRVSGIASNILIARLRSLQRLGLVTAIPYARRPVRMRYSLTEPGRRLGAAVTSLAEWGARRDGRATSARHEACGTPVELRPWCPTCDRPVVDDEVSDLTWC